MKNIFESCKKKFLFAAILFFLAIFFIALFFLRADSTKKNIQTPLSVDEIVSELKKRHALNDREILNINKHVFAQWYPMGSSMMIIPLGDDEEWLLDDYISLHFDGPPNYDSYGKGGKNSGFVEIFLHDVNKKYSDNIFLKNFLQHDLIVSLEFSDDSVVVFDRFYMEIEENLIDFHNILNETD